ncbi:MAG: shikimate kinase [Myxococcota bacterium]|nr:shikimate kinase [Myxococcota bacterium]
MDTERGGTLSLVGLSGSGKSTVARILAERWGWRPVDLDEEIADRAGLPVSEIFKRQGEAAFRDLERALLLEMLGRERIVLATGGGAPCAEGAMDALLAAGPTVWLQGAPQVLATRLGGAQDRPLLKSSSGSQILQRLREQLHVRGPVYARAPTSVDTDDRDPQEVATEVESLLSQTMEGPWRR